MPRHISSCRHGVVTYTLPISTTWDVSGSRALVTVSSFMLTTRFSPDFATFAPRACTYSGSASVLGTAIGRGAIPGRDSNAKWLISSGRQMLTSEQRGHLGLSSRGGGITPSEATRRSPVTACAVAATNSSSNGTCTRSRPATK